MDLESWLGLDFFLSDLDIDLYDDNDDDDNDDDVCRYIFPGLALGAALGQTGVITDTNAMIMMTIMIMMIVRKLGERKNRSDQLG